MTAKKSLIDLGVFGGRAGPALKDALGLLGESPRSGYRFIPTVVNPFVASAISPGELPVR